VSVLDAMQLVLENKVARAATMVSNRVDELRSGLGKARGSIARGRTAAARRVGELHTEHEKGGGYAFALQDFEDAVGDAGLGPVVEGEGNFHFGGTLARWTICKR